MPRPHLRPTGECDPGGRLVSPRRTVGAHNDRVPGALETLGSAQPGRSARPMRAVGDNADGATSCGGVRPPEPAARRRTSRWDSAPHRRLVVRRIRRGGGERGAVAIVVALLIPPVVLGTGALVLDIGQIRAERAQVQSGADAAAYKIASACAITPVGTACASDPGDPSATAYTNANSYAVDNANNNHAHISAVCGVGAPTLSTACPSGRNALNCPNPPTANTVEVHTQSGADSSSTLLPPIFGRALLGSSYNGVTVNACAQAAWGAAAGLGNAAGLTISACEWLNNTNNGTTFASPGTGSPASGPPSFLDSLINRTFIDNNGNSVTYTDPNGENSPDDPPAASLAGSETLIGTHETNNCNAGHPGWAAPGAFGWLTNSATSCTVSITGPEYSGVTGNSAANCAQLFLDSRTNQTPVYLPVYTSIDPNTGQYVLDGFAAFIITGWDVTSGQGGWDKTIAPVKEPSIISIADGTTTHDAKYCGTFTASSSDVCIYGYFTQKLIPASALPTGSGATNLGATSIRLTG